MKHLVAGWNVNFDPDLTLESYHIMKMNNYKPHISGFFELYSHFDFNQVISPFKGEAISIYRYTVMYRKFRILGLNIAGPCNKGKNCCMTDHEYVGQFVKLCKASKIFFDENEIGNKY